VGFVGNVGATPKLTDKISIIEEVKTDVEEIKNYIHKQ
jgi:hypothetical protein